MQNVFQDDVSHCAVFGDDNEQNEDDILEDEDLNPGQKRPSVGSTGTSSSSSEGPEGEEPVLLDLNKTNKEVENGGKIQNDDDQDRESSSSEEADIKPSQTETNGKHHHQIDLLGGE